MAEPAIDDNVQATMASDGDADRAMTDATAGDPEPQSEMTMADTNNVTSTKPTPKASASARKKKEVYAPQIGDLVFAKVKGYPWWPARIDPPPTDRKMAAGKFNVFFFGTYESAFVPAKELCPFEANKERHGKQKPNKGFNQGMEEIEVNPHLTVAEDLPDELLPPTVATNLSEEEKELMISEPVPAKGRGSRGKSAGAKAAKKERAPLASPVQSQASASSNRGRKRKSEPPASSPVPSVPETERLSRSGRKIKRPRTFEDDDGSSVVSSLKSPSRAGSVLDQPTEAPKDQVDHEIEPKTGAAKRGRRTPAKKDTSPAKKEPEVAQIPEPQPMEADSPPSPDDPDKLAMDKEEKRRRKQEEKEKLKEQKKQEKLEKKRLERMQEKTRRDPIQAMKDIEAEIVEALNVDQRDHERCLRALVNLDYMPVNEHMLKQYPSLLKTLKKVKKYSFDEPVRLKGDYLFNKFKSFFFNGTEEGQHDSNSNDSLKSGEQIVAAQTKEKPAAKKTTGKAAATSSKKKADNAAPAPKKQATLLEEDKIAKEVLEDLINKVVASIA